MQLSKSIRIVICLITLSLTMGSAIRAQSPQLSLADLLIGLRSKKATLQERNTLLTEAVRQRGVTFALTVEIEKELAATGATPTLIEAIRQKSPVVKPSPTPAPAVVKPTPIPTPPPPDFNFYQTRADQNAGRGEYLLAVSDYSKSLELKADNQIAYLNRGRAHYNLKSYDLSVKDFDKAVELNPKDSAAFINRGVAYEKLGETKKAMADYQKAVDLDPASTLATANLKRLQDAEAAAAAAEAARNTPPPPPEFVMLGNLTATNATRLVTPVYSQVAMRSNIEGRVTVEVELNEAGDVVAAKATSGHQILRSAAEEAAKRSKFKPATYDNRAIKAKGTIIYNFAIRPAGR